MTKLTIKAKYVRCQKLQSTFDWYGSEKSKEGRANGERRQFRLIKPVFLPFNTAPTLGCGQKGVKRRKKKEKALCNQLMRGLRSKARVMHPQSMNMFNSCIHSNLFQGIILRFRTCLIQGRRQNALSQCKVSGFTLGWQLAVIYRCTPM